MGPAKVFETVLHIVPNPPVFSNAVINYMVATHLSRTVSRYNTSYTWPVFTKKNGCYLIQYEISYFSYWGNHFDHFEPSLCNSLFWMFDKVGISTQKYFKVKNHNFQLNMQYFLIDDKFHKNSCYKLMEYTLWRLDGLMSLTLVYISLDVLYWYHTQNPCLVVEAILLYWRWSESDDLIHWGAWRPSHVPRNHLCQV